VESTAEILLVFDLSTQTMDDDRQYVDVLPQISVAAEALRSGALGCADSALSSSRPVQ
jgi:hypothetical protein